MVVVGHRSWGSQWAGSILFLTLFLGLCSHMSQIQSALRYVRLGDTEKIHLSFSLNCLTLKVCEGRTHQWKKNAWYCRVMSHCKQKRGWDSGSLRHPLFMLTHVPSQGSGFYDCLLLWCWGAHVHINMVVVHWNHEENRNVELRISATAGCACTRTGFDFPLWLSLCWSVGAHRALRECQEWPASDSCCMRSMSACKPSVAVLQYQVLWQQVAWQSYKAQVSAKG